MDTRQRLSSLQIRTLNFRSNLLDSSTKSENVEIILKYFLGFGKLIGVNLVNNIVICWCTRLLIPTLLLSHTTVDLIGWLRKPIADRATSAYYLCLQIASAQFYGIGAFIYIYLHLNQTRLAQFYSKWRQLPVDIVDTGLRRFSVVVPGLVLTSAILENVVFHFKMFPVFDPPADMGNRTSLHIYYERHHANWFLSVPFNPILACCLILANKFALYSWNYADLLTVCLSRALCFRFDAVYTSLKSGKLSWDQACQRYIQLMDMLDLLEKILSPLVFVCFYINLYATCMQLHGWMNPAENQHLLHTIYSLWSFIHLIVRITLVSHHAAKIQDLVQYYNIAVEQQCPQENYTKQISRQIRYPASTQRRGTGISGLGCFVITKPFMLKFASIAFFFEVFLITSEQVQVAQCS